MCNVTVAGEFVAQFKFTLLLMPNGPMKITGLTFDETLYESENSVTDEEMKVAAAYKPQVFDLYIQIN